MSERPRLLVRPPIGKPVIEAAGDILVPHFVALAMLLASAAVAMAVAQSSASIAYRTVVIPSSDLRLKAFLWTPAGSGPFPGVLFSHGRSDDAVHTGGLEFAKAAQRLGPVFARRGYAFLYLFRRGEGQSWHRLQRPETSKRPLLALEFRALDR